MDQNCNIVAETSHVLGVNEKVKAPGKFQFAEKAQHPGQTDGDCSHNRIPVANEQNVHRKHQQKNHSDDKRRRDPQRCNKFYVKNIDIHDRIDIKSIQDVQQRVYKKKQPE